jgi:hypothetical protein
MSSEATTERVKTEDKNKTRKSSPTGRTFLSIIYDGADVVGNVLLFSGQVSIDNYADDHGYDKEYDTPHYIRC